MQRRTFIMKSISMLSGFLMATPSLADLKKGEHIHLEDHNSHSHSDHSGHTMTLSENYRLGTRILTQEDIEQLTKADDHLMDRRFFPSGNALFDLNILKNNSEIEGTFKGCLHAKVSYVELVGGKSTEMWTYNETVPGPLIEVYEGDKVEITVINDLPEETTVHWHGLLVPPSEDGNPQDSILPGKRRTYRFTIPENSAGTYWYHPHGHNTVAEQVFKGLAGGFIVRSKNDLFEKFPEKHLLISDLKLNEDGSIADNSFSDWINGREGQFVLINGCYKPTIKLEEPTRFRIWNACSARYLHLSLDGSQIELIGTDGGLVEKSHSIDTLLLSPGERTELLITPLKSGSFMLKALAYDRDKMGDIPQEKTIELASFSLKKHSPPTLPSNLRRLPHYGVATVTKRIEFSEVMNDHLMLFLINGKMHDMDRIDLQSKRGAVEKWIVFNNSHMDHNFHIHGTQFYILERELNSVKEQPKIRGLHDTVNLRPYETITLLMRQDYYGVRMYHCHILEHETLGMMGQLEVI